MREMKYIRFCGNCNRYEYVVEAGPFMYKCTECFNLVAKEL